MKKSKINNILICIFFFWLLINGCAKTVSPKIQTKTNEPKDLYIRSPKTIEGITIDLKLLSLTDEYKKSIYAKELNLIYQKLKDNGSGLKNMKYIELFKNFSLFSVTVSNNTKNTLSMKKIKIIFTDSSRNKVYSAPDKFVILDSIESLPVYKVLTDYFIKNYTSKDNIHNIISKALKRLIRKQDFINIHSREIMPGKKYAGTVILPVMPDAILNGEISFKGIVPETDKKEKISQTTRFDFYVKKKHKF